MSLGIETLLGVAFTHLGNSFYCQNYFPQPRIVYLALYASVLWFELNWEWKWGLNILINLVCEGTSQIDLGGLVFFFAHPK